MDALQRLANSELLKDMELAGEDLSGVDLSKKELFQVRFKNCRLQESIWEHSRLESCAFEGCDLTRMRPRFLGALGVSFKGCKLMGVDWTDLSAGSQLSFEDCNLRYASFVGSRTSAANWRRTQFLRCRITEANFVDCDLTEADFAGSDLSGTIFRNCQLRKADLSRASGVFLDPAATRVKDVKIATDAAVRLACSLGMRVPEWEQQREKDARGEE